MTAAGRRVLLRPPLLARNLEEHLVGVGLQRRARELRVGHELVERLARLGDRTLLPGAPGDADPRLADERGRVGGGDLDRLFEGTVCERPVCGVDQRIAGREVLPGRVLAVGVEHLGVDVGALALHADLDEALREPRLRVLRLLGVGEAAGEAVERALGLRHVAERGVDHAELHVADLRVLAVWILLDVLFVGLRGVGSEASHTVDRALHAAPALADQEERRLLERDVLLLVLLGGRGVVHRLADLLDERREVLDRPDDLRGAAALELNYLGLVGQVGAAVEHCDSVLLVHLRELHLGLELAQADLLHLEVALEVRNLVRRVAELAVAAGDLRKRGHVAGRVGVVVQHDAPEHDRPIPVLVALLLSRACRRARRRRRVPDEVAAEPGVDVVGLGEVFELLLLGREPDERIARRGHDQPVLGAAEALGKVGLDGVAVEPRGRLLLVAFALVSKLNQRTGGVLDRRDRLHRLRVAGEVVFVCLGRVARRRRREHLVRGTELRHADALELLGVDVRLHLRAVLLLGECLDLLRQIAGRRRPRRSLVVEEHALRHRERALRHLALAALLRAEEVGLHLFVVALGLGVLLLRRVPQDLRLQVEALRQRREAHEALLAVWVRLYDLLVEVLELGAVLVDRRGRLVGVAARELEVGEHRDRPAKVNGLVVHVEEALHELARRLVVFVALLLVLRLVHELQVEVGRVAGEVAPLVVLETGQQHLVALGRLLELAVAHEQRGVGAARVVVERADVLRRLRIRLEEAVVDLHALLALTTGVEVVGHFEPRGPVLGAGAVWERGDLLLRLGELAVGEERPYVDREEPRLGLGPALLGRLAQRLGEVGVAVVDQLLDVLELVLELGILRRRGALALREEGRRHDRQRG